VPTHRSAGSRSGPPASSTGADPAEPATEPLVVVGGDPEADGPARVGGGVPGGHGHGHGHSPAAPAGRRVRLLLAALLGPFAVAALVGLVLLRPTGPLPHPTAAAQQQPVRADVVAAQVADCAPGDGQGACTGLTVHMSDGPRANRELVQIVPREPGTPRFAVGDPVVLAWSGGDPEDPSSYQVVDVQRGSPRSSPRR
jgi:hypothetical protein